MSLPSTAVLRWGAGTWGGGKWAVHDSILDEFTDPDGALSAAWNTGAWSGDPALLTIISGQVTSAANNFGAQAYNTPYGPDILVLMDVPVLPAGSHSVRLFIANSPTSATPNGYYLRVQPSGSAWRLQRLDAGVATTIGGNPTQAVMPGDSLALARVGTAVTSYYKPSGGTWDVVETVTDTTYDTTGYYIGPELDDNTTRIAAFGGGTVVAGGAQTIGPATVNATSAVSGGLVSHARLAGVTVNATSAVSVWAPTVWGSSPVFGGLTKQGHVQFTVGTVNATSTVSGHIGALLPLLLATVNATSTVTGSIRRPGLLHITGATVNASSTVTGLVADHLAPSVQGRGNSRLLLL